MHLTYVIDGTEYDGKRQWYCFDSIEWCAEEAAEHFYNHHDGCEDDYPLDIEIRIDGRTIGKASVEIDTMVVFHAFEK